MKAAPNTKAVTTMNDRAPRAVAAGKSGAAPSKAAGGVEKRMLGTKQPTATGKAKKPQFL